MIGFQDQLWLEIEEEIKMFGHVSIIYLSNVIRMDLLTQGQRIVARDSRLMLINREIISQAYWDSMAGEINEKLQECSQIFLAVLAA